MTEPAPELAPELAPVSDEDADLATMPHDALLRAARAMRAAIRAHRNSSGHDLCWHHPELWDLLPDRTRPDVAVPPWPQFLRGCVKYREALDAELRAAPVDPREA